MSPEGIAPATFPRHVPEMPEPIATPYSQPMGFGVSTSAARPGPYVPPDHRRPNVGARMTPTDLLTGDGPIPWIDAFLAATPAMGVGVIASPPAAVAPGEPAPLVETTWTSDSPVADEGDGAGELQAPAPPARSAESRAESAAQTLEILAQRVRAGELPLAGYDPALGDAAALVTALAAVLGVRLAE